MIVRVEAIVAYCKVLRRNSRRGTEENHEIRQDSPC